MTELEEIISAINQQLKQLDVFLVEVSDRPQTLRKDKLYDSVVAERTRLIEFSKLIYKLHAESQYR